MLSRGAVAFRGLSRLSNAAFSASPMDFELTTVRHRSSRSRRGLYDGKDVRSGNNVSFSMKSTKRKFKPNVFKKRVYSEILDEMLQFHLTTSALRSIDKAGGLDNYLLTSRHVTEGQGYEAKKRIMKVLKARKKMETKLAQEAVVDEQVVAVEEEEENEQVESEEEEEVVTEDKQNKKE